MNERLLVRIWQSGMLRGKELATASGLPLRVVRPGRFNTGSGPDFLRAAVSWENRGVVTGDIELHVRSSDWRSHSHHCDRRYNQVILHVTMWHDREWPTLREDGETVPVLALFPYLKFSTQELERLCSSGDGYRDPCSDAKQRLGGDRVVAHLDAAGEERFELKAGYFAQMLSSMEADQVLYEGLMGALGYSQNKALFQELARRLSWRMLRRIASGESKRRRGPVLGKALLDAAAGMSGWEPSGTRPCNRPERRLAGAGYLFARYVDRGLARGLREVVQGVAPKAACAQIERKMMVGNEGQTALIGRGRAREMVVNVILPFFYAWGGSTSQARQRGQARQMYQTYPRLEQNQITRQMGRQLFGEKHSGIVTSARRQQGLIHIYHNFCLDAECATCGLG